MLEQQELHGAAVSPHSVIDQASSHYSINDAVLNVILREYPRYVWCLYLTAHLSKPESILQFKMNLEVLPLGIALLI